MIKRFKENLKQMKEIEPSKSTDDLWKSFAAVGIAAAVGLGIGYAYQTGNNEELAQALSVANSKVGLLTSREKSLSTGLAEANNRASSTGTEWIKARDENLALTEKLKQTQEEAKLRERGLHEEVASLTDEIAKIKTRANALTKAIDPAVLKEIEGSMNVAASGPKSSNKDASIARNKELLKKFTRMSDDFTRPKVYIHDYFLRRKDSSIKGDPKAHARLKSLTINTEGSKNGGTFTSLKVVHADDVITFTELDSLIQFLINHDFTDGDLKCRLTWDEIEIGRSLSTLRDRNPNLLPNSKVSDLTLDKDDAIAFKETLELAASFEEINRLK